MSSQDNAGQASRGRRRFKFSMSTAGAVIVTFMLVICLGSLPYTLGRARALEHRSDAGLQLDAASQVSPANRAVRRFEATDAQQALLPPFWAPKTADERARIATLKSLQDQGVRSWLGTDRLGRSMLVRCLAGGGISLGIGLSAAAIAVIIGTLYGTISGWSGGRVDTFMMRIVDILYGLPYILLVVLLAVAVNGLAEPMEGAPDESGIINRQSSIAAGFLASINKDVLNLITLLVAIGGVSWLTMARVIRGQVLSLKQQPFMEACRAIGVPRHRQFLKHLLPNLLGPIIVYATLTAPTAILSESFLSFLGIGVQEPLPSWGNLAAAGLSELNTVRVRWWLLLWPCLFIAVVLLALNFLGEGLREKFDPRHKA